MVRRKRVQKSANLKIGFVSSKEDVVDDGLNLLVVLESMGLIQILDESGAKYNKTNDSWSNYVIVSPSELRNWVEKNWPEDD